MNFPGGHQQNRIPKTSRSFPSDWPTNADGTTVWIGSATADNGSERRQLGKANESSKTKLYRLAKRAAALGKLVGISIDEFDSRVCRCRRTENVRGVLD